MNLLFDSDKERNSDNARECLGKIFDLVIELDGTISGEHGIGIVKKDFL